MRLIRIADTESRHPKTIKQVNDYLHKKGVPLIKKAMSGIAIHLTTEDNKKRILENGSFMPSKSGWYGEGLYAHLSGTGKEGKGDAKVGFSYEGLKLNDSGKPEELTQKEWDRIRHKNTKQIDNTLYDLGYDGEVYGTTIRIFPQSVEKLIPIDINGTAHMVRW